MGETYKVIRPRKHYSRRPWRRPGWHAGHKSSKFYHSKRMSPDDYYSHRPNYYRHGFAHEDIEDDREGQPYTIVIQLAKGKYVPSNYIEQKRKYERESIPIYSGESDYIDDDEESESRVLNINDKRVRVKMIKGENPQLQIKISRSDNEKDIEVVDKSNVTVMGSTLLSILNPHSASLKQQSMKNMTTTMDSKNIR